MVVVGTTIGSGCARPARTIGMYVVSDRLLSPVVGLAPYPNRKAPSRLRDGVRTRLARYDKIRYRSWPAVTFL